MAKIRIELDQKGVRSLLRSEAVGKSVEAVGQKIADAAGEGFEVDVWQGKDRVRATVETKTYEAQRAEAEERALSRALEAGRS
ncbi:hypothetical protein ACFYE2_00485 [Kocuria sp. CPCC 205300]|uniref:hypothetical protein n=1 Tax=Kocuria sabuli TaxID=3071448 RepID=UPI0036D91A5E